MPDDAGARLEHRLARLRRSFPDARWLRREGWHVTLLFLGAVLPDRVPELRALVDAAGRQHAGFIVRTGRPGGRSGKDGVAWLGLEAGGGRVVALAAWLAERCPPDISLGRPPRRTQGAHLTLARRAGPDVVAGLRDAADDLGASWRVDRVVLYRSHLGREGAAYEALHEAVLHGSA